MPDPSPKKKSKKSKVTVRTERGSHGFSSGKSKAKSYSIADAINIASGRKLGNGGAQNDSSNFTKTSQERAKDLFKGATITPRK